MSRPGLVLEAIQGFFAPPDAGDTLANDVGLLGVRFDYQADM